MQILWLTCYACAKKITDKLPKKIANNGKTIKTLMQIIKAINGIEGFPCEECGSVEWTHELISPNKEWLASFLIIPNQRGDPNKSPYIRPNKDFSFFEKQECDDIIEKISPLNQGKTTKKLNTKLT